MGGHHRRSQTLPSDGQPPPATGPGTAPHPRGNPKPNRVANRRARPPAMYGTRRTLDTAHAPEKHVRWHASGTQRQAHTPESSQLIAFVPSGGGCTGPGSSCPHDAHVTRNGRRQA
nr:unnamed protein product [Digitaria exilis]